MGSKKKNKTATENTEATAASGGEAERPRCPSCGRLLPKPKPVDKEKVLAKKQKNAERLEKLKAQIAALEERGEKFDAQLEQAEGE